MSQIKYSTLIDTPLRDFLGMADATHDYLDKFCIGLSVEQVESKLLELQNSIRIIQSVAKRLADISNITNRVLNQKKAQRTKAKDTKYIDPYPNDTDHAILRTLNPITTIPITNGISIPVKMVDTTKELPVSNLYFVKDVNQFAININGIIIKGNLSNLVEYQTTNTARCEYGTDCKSFKKTTTCNYYHDPEDYIKLNYKVPTDLTRNFTIGSWLYSKSKNPRTYFTRHLGSKDRIIYDLNTLKKVQYREEISNREGQLIHDLLIYMILNSQGLLERYQLWS